MQIGFVKMSKTLLWTCFCVSIYIMITTGSLITWFSNTIPFYLVASWDKTVKNKTIYININNISLVCFQFKAWTTSKVPIFLEYGVLSWFRNEINPGINATLAPSNNHAGVERNTCHTRAESHRLQIQHTEVVLSVMSAPEEIDFYKMYLFHFLWQKRNTFQLVI